MKKQFIASMLALTSATSLTAAIFKEAVVTVSNHSSKVCYVVVIATLTGHNSEIRSVAPSKRVASGETVEFDLKEEWQNPPANKHAIGSIFKGVVIERYLLIDNNNKIREFNTSDKKITITEDHHNDKK